MLINKYLYMYQCTYIFRKYTDNRLSIKVHIIFEGHQASTPTRTPTPMPMLKVRGWWWWHWQCLFGLHLLVGSPRDCTRILAGDIFSLSAFPHWGKLISQFPQLLPLNSNTLRTSKFSTRVQNIACRQLRKLSATHLRGLKKKSFEIA